MILRILRPLILISKFAERHYLRIAFAKYLNSHPGVLHPYTYRVKVWHPKLGNVASKEILLDTAGIHQHNTSGFQLIVLCWYFWMSYLKPVFQVLMQMYLISHMTH